MPNWCTNTLTVLNPTNEQVQRIASAAITGNLLDEFFPGPEEYDYDWCVENWGTKWDVSDVYVDQQPTELTVCFNTAWSPPGEEWFTRFSQALPGCDIANTFSEPGFDFYGQTVALNGEVSTVLGSIADVKSLWIADNYTPEQIEIYNDEDHEEHEEVSERINDIWYEVEGDVLDEALAKL